MIIMGVDYHPGLQQIAWIDAQKAQCTRGRYKYLAIHIHEAARQRARELANTPEFAHAQRQRK